jgi:D-lactate dehydrogenase
VYRDAGALFFTDFQQVSIAERMSAWDFQFTVLKSFPNVLITPHSAFLTKEALASITDTVVSNITEFAEVRWRVRA